MDGIIAHKDLRLSIDILRNLFKKIKQFTASANFSMAKTTGLFLNLLLYRHEKNSGKLLVKKAFA